MVCQERAGFESKKLKSSSGLVVCAEKVRYNMLEFISLEILMGGDISEENKISRKS